MGNLNWIQVEPGMVEYTGPDFNATLYLHRNHHPSGELERRPSQLPSRAGWSVIGDMPRSPIRGIRNFNTLEEGQEAVERTFQTYRKTMARDGLTAAEIKDGLSQVRKAEDEKYRRQVRIEHQQRDPGACRRRGVSNLTLKVGS